MIRAATLFWLSVGVFVVWGLFHVKDAVRDLEHDIAAVQGEIAGTRQAIRVLEAEWAYLNRPDRLETLSSRYLGMTPADSAYVGRPDDLPLRFDLIAEHADGTDETRDTTDANTGSVR